MTEILGHRSFKILLFFSSIASLLIAGSASDPSQVSKDGKNAETPPRSHSQGLGFKVLVICFGVAAVVAFSVFLFKKWQKKKREEQHARLLRLFEEDDELELELGLRD